MTPPIFALDACVLVSSALRDTLLRAAEANFYSPRWSEIILEEVRRTLVNKQFTDEQRAQRLLVTLRSVFPRAMVTGFEQHIDAMTNHPKDRHVVAAAIEARATRIITRNVRDFPARALASCGHARAHSRAGGVSPLPTDTRTGSSHPCRTRNAPFCDDGTKILL